MVDCIPVDKEHIYRNMPTTESHYVSIIIPCRDEDRLIAKCLDSIIANDYPKDVLEVLVVDGMSDDRTRDIVVEYARKFPFITMLDNPKRYSNRL